MEGIYIIFIFFTAILVPILLYVFFKTDVILGLKYKFIEFRRILIVRKNLKKINYPEILENLSEIDSEYKTLMNKFQNLKHGKR